MNRWQASVCSRGINSVGFERATAVAITSTSGPNCTRTRLALIDRHERRGENDSEGAYRRWEHEVLLRCDEGRGNSSLADGLSREYGGHGSRR